MNLHSLHIYPVKSCRSVDLTHANIRPRGLAHDRRWMIVDAAGQFISQRSHPILTQLSAGLEGEGLRLNFGGQTLHVAPPSAVRIDVTVWKSTVNAPIAHAAVNAALSAWLGQTVRLVYMDAAAKRAVSQDWAAGHETSFSDGYPVLIANTASLAAVNAHLKASGHSPINMARFRPNVVIETDMPWAEDNWTSLQIGDAVLDLIKPCTRCTVTSLDPLSGAAQPQPVMDILRKNRMSQDPRNKGVLFGVNAVVRRGGEVKLGATVRA